MARKRIAISSGGGIAAGSPFVLDAGLFVSQASPPVANTGRLARLNDASLSIIAPGVIAPDSFVLGHTVVDCVGGDRSILIGRLISQGAAAAGQANDQILIGNTINLSTISTGCTDLIVIGARPVFSVVGFQPDKKRSVVIGNDITMHTAAQASPTDGMVIIGHNARGEGGQVVSMGYQAVARSGGVGIGANSNAHRYSVAVGYLSSTELTSGNWDDNCTAVGFRAWGQLGCVAIGSEAGYQSTSLNCVAIGLRSGSFSYGNKAAMVGSIVIGYGATCSKDNIAVLGSALAPINILTFGAGDIQSTGGGLVYTIEPTYTVAGANNQKGNGLAVRGGTGTGNWANAENLGLDLQAGLLQASGTTRQAPTSVLAIRHSDLNVALWGGLGATMGSGVKVLFVANATTAPTVAPTGGGLLYVTGGALHWLGSGGTDTAIAPA